MCETPVNMEKEARGPVRPRPSVTANSKSQNLKIDVSFQHSEGAGAVPQRDGTTASLQLQSGSSESVQCVNMKDQENCVFTEAQCQTLSGGNIPRTELNQSIAAEHQTKSELTDNVNNKGERVLVQSHDQTQSGHPACTRTGSTKRDLPPLKVPGHKRVSFDLAEG